MIRLRPVLITSLFLAGVNPIEALAATVKFTALGSHGGEMCRFDRAVLMEDPNGTTILFDAGRTVAGAGDPRLPAKLDVVLVSSVHSDHQGDKRLAKQGAGSCARPLLEVTTVPNSNSVEIAAGKGAYIVGAGQMRAYLVPRMTAAGAKKEDATRLTKRVRPGGKLDFNGVKVAAVPTVHSNGADPDFVLDPALSAALKKSGLTAYAGPDSGFVITFSNGLVIYLSADTGHTSDMDTVVRRYYKAKLAVVNMGDVNTMGPEEAAWAVNELLKPKTVIPAHANEESTRNGELITGSKTDRFIRRIDDDINVYLPLTGRTMEFDADANCVKGCAAQARP